MPEEEFKIACPHCGQHYQVESSMSGATVECAKCGKSFMIEDPSPSQPGTVPVEISVVRKGRGLRTARMPGVIAGSVAAIAVVVLASIALSRGKTTDDSSSKTLAASRSQKPLVTEEKDNDDNRSVREQTTCNRNANGSSAGSATMSDDAETEPLQVEKESMLERVRKGNLMPCLLDGVIFNAATGRYEIPEKHRSREKALNWNQVLDQDEHRHGYSWERQVAATLQNGGPYADAAETMLNRYLSGELTVPADGNGSFDPKTGRIVPEKRGTISTSAQAWNLALSIDEIRFGYSWERTRMLGPRKIRRWSFFHQFINGTVKRPPLSVGEVFDWLSGKIVRKDGKDLSGSAKQFNIMIENAMVVSGRSWKDCLSEWRNLPPLSRDERAVRSFAEQVVRGEVNPPLSVGETINMDTGEIYRPDGRPISGAAQQWNIDVERDCLLFGYTWKDERNEIANDRVRSTAPDIKPKRKSGMFPTEFPKPPKVKRPVW